MTNNESLLRRFSRARPTVVRHASDTLAANWRELVRLSGPEATDRIFDEHGNSASPFKRQFRTCLRIADAYYLAYLESDDIVDPLLLYYGNLWLASALIYAVSSPIRAKAWRANPLHGTRPRFDESEPDDILKATIIVQGHGTLQTFCMALGGDDPKNSTFRIVDLLKYLPDLEGVLADTIPGFETSATLAVPMEKDNFSNSFDRDNARWIHENVYCPGLMNTESLLKPIALLPVLEQRRYAFHPSNPYLKWDCLGGEGDDLRAFCIAAGSSYYFEARIGTLYIPELALYLMVSHALSEFARYYPDDWLQMHDEHTSAYAVVREFVSVVERKFPNLILNELTLRNYVFYHS